MAGRFRPSLTCLCCHWQKRQAAHPIFNNCCRFNRLPCKVALTWHGPNRQQGRTAKAKGIGLRQLRQLAAAPKNAGQRVRAAHKGEVGLVKQPGCFGALPLRCCNRSSRAAPRQRPNHPHNRAAPGSGRGAAAVEGEERLPPSATAPLAVVSKSQAGCFKRGGGQASLHSKPDSHLTM